MGGIARKLAARFMALAAVFMFALGFGIVANSQQAQAADKGDIQNVVISPEGLLSWDAFEGAGSYYYSVSGTGAGFGGRLDYSECPVDLYEECMYYHCPSGTFNVSLVARQNSDWPYGDEVSNTWRGTYTFTRPAGPTHTVSFDSNGGSGTMAPMTAEDDAKFTLPPCTLTPPEGCTFRAWLVNGEEMKEYYTFICTEDTTVKALWKYPPQDIQNVKISPTGILTWDPYEGAGIYSLGIFNYGSMIKKSSTSVDLYQICQDRGFSPDQDYDVCFYAEENDSWPYGEEVSLRWYGSYRYQEFPALVLCDGEHYYVNADRTLVANTWKKIDGYWYFFNDDGTMAKSTWKKDSKGWCYVGEDGKMLTSGWAKDGKGWCWVDSSGYMATATKWIKVDGSWYHITKGYRDASKWMKDSKGWCYLGEDGVMLTNGFAKDGKGWCYIGSNGYMVTATKWIKVDGYWYHITKGYRDASKWVKDSKGWC